MFRYRHRRSSCCCKSFGDQHKGFGALLWVIGTLLCYASVLMLCSSVPTPSFPITLWMQWVEDLALLWHLRGLSLYTQVQVSWRLHLLSTLFSTLLKIVLIPNLLLSTLILPSRVTQVNHLDGWNFLSDFGILILWVLALVLQPLDHTHLL